MPFDNDIATLISMTIMFIGALVVAIASLIPGRRGRPNAVMRLLDRLSKS